MVCRFVWQKGIYNEIAQNDFRLFDDCRADTFYCRIFRLCSITPVEEYDYDDYDNAIIEYSRILVSDFDVSKTYIFTDQDIISAFLNRGKVYYNRQEYAKAVWDFSMILKMEPRNKRALLCRAKAYEVFAPDLARADYEAAEKFGTEYFVVAKKVQRN